MLSEDKVRKAAALAREAPLTAPIALVIEDLHRERNRAAADSQMWRNMALMNIKLLRAAADSLMAVSEFYDDHIRDFEAPGEPVEMADVPDRAGR